MAQFYFLSILLNLLTGLVLVFGKSFADETLYKPLGSDEFDGYDVDDESDVEVDRTMSRLDINSRSFRLVVGILGVFVAVMKLVSVFRSDVPLIGDFIPFLAGFLGGSSLLLEYYVSTSSEVFVPESIQHVFVDNRKIMGYACIAAAVLHFVFPQIVLL